MVDLIGRDIGRYHVIENLGAGGMAVVYKAYDTRLEREVAIKVIRREAITPEQYDNMLHRFDREAKALARMTHPNIVAVYDFGEYEGSPYLVMAYIPGGTLKARMGRMMPYDEAARLLAPVARSLEYAHQRKIIHRDVKPVNILLTETGQPMLSDFGIAKILESDQTTVLTSTGVGVGTPEYVAPEQAMGRGVDHRADIYSMGIIFFEMLTGKKPYQADTPLAVIIKHINDPLPRPRDIVPGLPEEVEFVIFKCLAKSPDDRYQDMGELASVLERLAQRQLLPREAFSSAFPMATPGEETRVAMEAETRVSVTPTPPPPSPTETVPMVETQPETQPVMGEETRAASEAATRVGITPIPPPPSSTETVPFSGTVPVPTTQPAAVIGSETLPMAPPHVGITPPKRSGLPAGLIIGGVLVLVVAVLAVVGLLVVRPLLAGKPQIGETAVTTQRPVRTDEIRPTEEQPVEEGESTETSENMPVETQPVEAAGPQGYEPIPLPANPRTMGIAFTSEPDHVVYYFFGSNEARQISSLVLAGLIDFNADNQPFPELASEIPSMENGGISEDQQTITWHLRPNLYWSDGVPITVEDIVFTTDVLKARQYHFEYSNIDRMTPIDELTLEMHFSEVTPTWYTLFPYLLPAHLLRDAGDIENHPFIHSPTVGSGPFVIVDWQPGNYISLLPNPNFYLGRPLLDQVVIRFYPDEFVALDAMSAGEVDLIAHPALSGREPIPFMEEVEGRGFLQVIAPQLYKERYVFQLASTSLIEGFPDSRADRDGFCPFRDVRVRQAIILATNRPRISQDFWAGFTDIPVSDLDNTLWENPSQAGIPFDPDHARALLAEAGYEDGDGDGVREGNCDGQMVSLSFTLITTQQQLRVELAELVRSNLAEVGIEMIPQHLSGAELFGDGTYTGGGLLNTGNYDMTGYAINITEIYPYQSLICDLPSEFNPEGTSNFFLCDPQLFTLIQEANAVADIEMRRPLVNNVEDYFSEMAFQMLLYNRFRVYYYRPGVVLEGLNAQVGPFWNAEAWNIER